MSSKHWSDEKIISAITGEEHERENALRHIFLHQKWQKMAIKYLVAKGGNIKDAEDVFQEAIIIFDRNIRHGKFKGKSRLKTYFLSIIKHLWWQILSKKHPQVELNPQLYDKAVDDIEINFIKEERKHFFEQALGNISERCQIILKLYQLDYSMIEIADVTGISSAAMAKKEAYRCRMRFRRFLEANPAWLEILK